MSKLVPNVDALIQEFNTLMDGLSVDNYDPEIDGDEKVTYHHIDQYALVPIASYVEYYRDKYPWKVEVDEEVTHVWIVSAPIEYPSGQSYFGNEFNLVVDEDGTRIAGDDTVDDVLGGGPAYQDASYEEITEWVDEHAVLPGAIKVDFRK